MEYCLLATLRIENKIKPGIFDEKRGNAALLIKNSGFYFVRDPKEISESLAKNKKAQVINLR